MSNRQGADARRDATSGHIVRFQGPGAAALDQVIEVRTLEGQSVARMRPNYIDRGGESLRYPVAWLPYAYWRDWIHSHTLSARADTRALSS